MLHKSAAEFVSHLRNSPLGVSSSKEKLRVILDLSFGKGGAVDEYIGVNGDTAFEKAPKSETGGVMPAILRRIWALREAVGEREQACIAVSAPRGVRVAPIVRCAAGPAQPPRTRTAAARGRTSRGGSRAAECCPRQSCHAAHAYGLFSSPSACPCAHPPGCISTL